MGDMRNYFCKSMAQEIEKNLPTQPVFSVELQEVNLLLWEHLDSAGVSEYVYVTGPLDF